MAHTTAAHLPRRPWNACMPVQGRIIGAAVSCSPCTSRLCTVLSQHVTAELAQVRRPTAAPATNLGDDVIVVRDTCATLHAGIYSVARDDLFAGRLHHGWIGSALCHVSETVLSTTWPTTAQMEGRGFRCSDLCSDTYRCAPSKKKQGSQLLVKVRVSAVRWPSPADVLRHNIEVCIRPARLPLFLCDRWSATTGTAPCTKKCGLVAQVLKCGRRGRSHVSRQATPSYVKFKQCKNKWFGCERICLCCRALPAMTGTAVTG